MSKSPWHTKEIEKGELGQLSKILEELEEAIDAEAQGQDLMLMFELSDIIGACGLVAERYGMNLDQLVKFSKLRSKVAIADVKQEVQKKSTKKSASPAGKICVGCHNGTIVLTRGKGRYMHKDNGSFEVPEDLEIPACNNCGDKLLNVKIAEELDKAHDEQLSKQPNCKK